MGVLVDEGVLVDLRQAHNRDRQAHAKREREHERERGTSKERDKHMAKTDKHKPKTRTGRMQRRRQQMPHKMAPHTTKIGMNTTWHVYRVCCMCTYPVYGVWCIQC